MNTHHVTFNDYEALCRQIWDHNERYYVESRPTISDDDFDRLLHKLQQIENDHPDWILPTSPTQRVGEALTEGFKTVVHKVPMLSLANTYSKEEIEEFIHRCHKLVGRAHLDFSCELKMDGIAITAIYEKGSFVRGVTRGNGKEGDDITANMKTIKSLPLRLKGDHLPERLEVRGEVFMPHKVFKVLNEEKISKEEPEWANPRNAASGSLKLLNPKEVAKRNLSVVFYGLAEDSFGQVTTQDGCHKYLHHLGLPILEMHKLCHDIATIWAFTEQVRKARPTLKYDIDGVVIKLNELSEQKRLGNTSKNPRWAIAYKFAPEQATTKINQITVQVGRTGILTPVAELEPVFLAGSTIARATLHNEDEVERKGIRIGDTVTIEKGGDVIPKVVSVSLAHRNPNSTPWHMPLHCPSCHAKVVRPEGEVAVRCPNHRGCPEQRLRYLIYFVSKAAMDIDNMGEKVVEQLVHKNLISNASDIYRLKESDLYLLDGFKDKSVHNLMQSIEKSKNMSLSRFIMALSIKHVGATTAELLAAKAGSIEALSKMNIEDLLSIDGVGDIVATAVHDYFRDEGNLKEIHELLKLGCTPKQQEVVTFHNHSFNGKTFVLTGTLKGYTRDRAAALIKERGGKVASAISKNTDYLLAGEDVGSKFDKAKALGVKIMTEEQFAGHI
jgi:DNA ligase (NAD+)